MDKSLFVSMGSAQNAMHELEVITNNLANVNTTGFRGDTTFVEQYNIAASANNSRVYSKLSGTYTNFDQGSIFNTDRDLDVAIKGNGFIAVQSKSGKEGYTRAGSLQLKNGVLTTQTGELVLGNGGIINIPPAEKISISPDGTVSVKLSGQIDLVTVDKIKLTNPDISQIEKGSDSLFYMKGGSPAKQDDKVDLVSGALEGSNVNAIETMTQLINLTRNYQIDTNFMKTISENGSKINQILELSR